MGVLALSVRKALKPCRDDVVNLVRNASNRLQKLDAYVERAKSLVIGSTVPVDDLVAHRTDLPGGITERWREFQAIDLLLERSRPRLITASASQHLTRLALDLGGDSHQRNPW